MLVSSDVTVTKYLTQQPKKERFILAHSLRVHSSSQREGMVEGTQSVIAGKAWQRVHSPSGREGMAEGTQSVRQGRNGEGYTACHVREGMVAEV